MVYVEGHTIINLANKLFGFNGWSSEIKSMTTDYVGGTYRF
jgi:DNA repair and recombination protein RAD52